MCLTLTIAALREANRADMHDYENTPFHVADTGWDCPKCGGPVLDGQVYCLVCREFDPE